MNEELSFNDKYFSIRGKISGNQFWIRLFLQNFLIVIFGLGLVLQIITYTQRVNSFRGIDKRWENFAIGIAALIGAYIGGGLFYYAADIMTYSENDFAPELIYGLCLVLPHLYLLFKNAETNESKKEPNSTIANQKKVSKVKAIPESGNISKEEAIKEIKQLKELLDSGILTQEEFDKKSAELKKIILGNQTKEIVYSDSKKEYEPLPTENKKEILEEDKPEDDSSYISNDNNIIDDYGFILLCLFIALFVAFSVYMDSQ